MIVGGSTIDSGCQVGEYPKGGAVWLRRTPPRWPRGCGSTSPGRCRRLMSLTSGGGLVKDAFATPGPAPDANSGYINLACQLQDQQQIYVPRRGTVPLAPAIIGGVPVQSSSAAVQSLANIRDGNGGGRAASAAGSFGAGPADGRLPRDVRLFLNDGERAGGAGRGRGDVNCHPRLYYRGTVRIQRGLFD